MKKKTTPKAATARQREHVSKAAPRQVRKRTERGIRQHRTQAPPRSVVLLNRLVHEAQASFEAWHIPEPKLVFANGMKVEDPKTGLSLYGPAAMNGTARPLIRIGIVGSGDTIQMLNRWLDRARGEIVPGLNAKKQPYDPILAMKFPGFDADTSFGCRIETTSPLTETLTEKEIEQAVSPDDFQQRVKNVVSLVSRRLEVLHDREPAPDVVVVAMPELVEKLCGVEGRRGRRKGQVKLKLPRTERNQLKLEKESSRLGQQLLAFLSTPPPAPSADEESVADLNRYWDFHNALKAGAMECQLPTQLIWESTLSGEGRNQDPATTAWNFFTALYYKAGNVPWELDFPTAGTCFVGVTFYRESPDPNSPTRTSLAQVFSETGEGLVLKGGEVKWDKDRDKKPHLTGAAAKELLTRALDAYRQHYSNRPPTRVVVHKTSRFWEDELAGFRGGLGDVHSYDFLALERRGIRFLRLGYEPPVRGTVIRLAKRNYLVYTNGYVPFLRAYPGMRVPNPLEVVEHWGDSSADRVCSELLALTKLNWNTCSYGSGDPITTAFSKQVGRILTEVKTEKVLTKYRFFM